jgi:hypothetical protein
MKPSTLAERALSAGRTLMRWITDREARVRYGAKEREMLLGKLRSGDPVLSHYRTDWLTSTANKVLAVLRESVNEFNGRYPWNAISNQDLSDVLHTVLHRVQENEEEDHDDDA